MEVTIHLGSSGELGSALQVYLHSEPGNRPDNQDIAANRWVGQHWVGVVADGAGGHSGGRLAAELVTKSLIGQFEQTPTLCPERLRGMVESANSTLRSAQRLSAEHSSMHSTVCLLAIHVPTRQATWLHVGDTRIYHFRDESCLSQSKDHSMLQWAQDSAPHLDISSRNALYSAMGQSPEQLVIDALPAPITLRQGDCLLLCTDGVWEFLSSEELALIQMGIGDHTQLIAHVHQLAMQRAGGRADNLTSLAAIVS